VDIIRDSNETVVIRGYVPSANPYAANHTLVQMSSKACGLQASCTATAEAAVAPSCSLSPVDMSLCGMEGLVTDRSAKQHCNALSILISWHSFQNGLLCCRDTAVLVVSCSKTVSGLCYPAVQSCMYVDGPANTTIVYVSEVSMDAVVYYHLRVSWEVGDQEEAILCGSSGHPSVLTSMTDACTSLYLFSG
jgi:hypothetical protein